MVQRRRGSCQRAEIQAQGGGRHSPWPEPWDPHVVGLVPPWLLVTQPHLTRKDPGEAEQWLPWPPPQPAPCPRATPTQEETLGL